jgi:hypothetical protein
MEFRILGPLEVVDGDRREDVPVRNVSAFPNRGWPYMRNGGALSLAVVPLLGPCGLGRLLIGRAEITARSWVRKRRETT